MEEDYVSFEIAKLLKGKGFNEKCRGFYVLHASGEARFCSSTSYEEGWNFNKEEKFVFSAPTIQMVMKWLYKNYGIYYGFEQWQAYNNQSTKMCIVDCKLFVQILSDFY